MTLKFAALALAACMFAGCGAQSRRETGPSHMPAAYDPAAVPKGPTGDAIKYGHDLVTGTRKYMRAYVSANMDCEACHVNGGTVPRGGSFSGTAASFPQWNKRAHRVIALQDRLAECFLYSMNGHPPAYNSREMVALTSYITYLSRGIKIGAKPDPAVALASITLADPDKRSGGQLYAQKCAVCHGAGGGGNAAYPPLWGATSFNDGAGMHRLRTMAGFIRYNMPQNAPGSLTDRQAFDIAAFVLAHDRPTFKKGRFISFPPSRAGYF